MPPGDLANCCYYLRKHLALVLKTQFPGLEREAAAIHDYIYKTYDGLKSPFYPWMNFCVNAPLPGSTRDVMVEGHADTKNKAIFVCCVLVYWMYRKLLSSLHLIQRHS